MIVIFCWGYHFTAFAAHVICENIMPLSEIADATENGKYYPLMLITLQNVHKSLGKTALSNLFNKSSVSRSCIFFGNTCDF